VGFWTNKKVLVTGHTGFKGGWLSLILNSLGAKVYGISLPPENDKVFFEVTNLEKIFQKTFYEDINNFKSLESIVKNISPDLIFHLAAQPLVRESYIEPLTTLKTNIIGTANLLESVKKIENTKAIVCITSDKCYDNKEWSWPYREVDRLGGHDIYSASKAAAEIVISAYKTSFFHNKEVFISSARAGNVIGGGDWSKDRLLPDLIRSSITKKPIQIRSPNAVRPWQHVLEPLWGYTLLAKKMFQENYQGEFNFGPSANDNKNVKWVCDTCKKLDKDISFLLEEDNSLHEANFLTLDSSKASFELNWHPKMNAEDAIFDTIEWYCAWKDKKDMFNFSFSQIEKYINNELV